MGEQFVDFSWHRPTQADLQGFAGVMRYLETGGSRPDLTIEEVKRLHSWGKRIGLIWEVGTGDALAGYAAGVTAAKRANAAADALGAPKTAAIFYTVDTDTTGAQVKPYFDGIRSVAGRPVGIYGGHLIVEWAKSDGIPYRWQALGWAHGLGVSDDAHLHQYSNNVSLPSGAIVDKNNVFVAFPTWNPAPASTGGSVSVPTAYDVLKVAASQIGYREGRDASGNWNNINKYGAWYGSNGVAWCAIFISWLFNEVGALGTLAPKFAWCPTGLQWFRNRDQTGYWPPQAGDIFFIRRYVDGRESIPHVGIVERYLGGGKIQTIEGNTNDGGSYQGNGVYRLTRQDSETGTGIIYARPKYTPGVSGGTGTGVSTPTPAPAPAPVTSIPVPTRYDFSRVVRVDDEALRLGRRSDSAVVFNARLWSWLYYRAGAAGRAYCVKANAAWQKESSAVFGTQTMLAMQEAYRILNASNPTRWPKGSTVQPKPTWPGPQFLAVLAIKGD